METENITLWRQRIADRNVSGLKITDWCMQHQVSKYAYYYWKRKIADLDHGEPDRQLFAEIPASTEKTYKSTADGILIEWKEFSLKITDIHSIDLAAELLAKLQKLC